MPFLASSYNLLFLLGAIAALAIERTGAGAGRLLLLAGLAAFVAVGALDLAFGREVHKDVWTITYGAASMAILVGAVALERGGRLRVDRPVAFLGDASYAIYLVHSPVMGLVALVAARAEFVDMLSPSIWLVILVAAGVLAGAVLHLAFEKPLAFLLSAAVRRMCGVTQWA